MSSRGVLSFLSLNDFYKESKKDWVVELENYHRYWYDLVVNPNDAADYFDSRKFIVDHLKGIKKEVEDCLEKRFVYFICSRERVRFNVNKRPSYNMLTKNTKIHVLVGDKGKKKSIKCKFMDRYKNKVFFPSIKVTDKYLTFKDSAGVLTTYSIHDFLDEANVLLGLNSRVEYVGYTKNPHTRPTNGSHTGLSDVLHEIAEEKRDSIIYFNAFKVVSLSKESATLMNFSFPNSMTDEIDVELEGKILEKCFIFYFDSSNQKRNKSSELVELERSLLKLSREKNIESIHVVYEVDNPTEYGIFSSSKVPAQKRHIFTVQGSEEGVSIKDGSSIFDRFINKSISPYS